VLTPRNRFSPRRLLGSLNPHDVSFSAEFPGFRRALGQTLTSAEQ
jgi:hypothetical protein